MFKILKEYFFNIFNDAKNNDFFSIASEMSYMFTLAIFPFMLFLMWIFGLLGRKFAISKIVLALSQIAPHDAISLIERVLDEAVVFNQGALVALIGFFVTLFLASSGVFVTIKGFNRTAGIKETRNYFYVRAISILMVFVNAIFLFISVNLIVFGHVILNFASDILSISIDIYQLILNARWFVAFLMLFIMASVNYYVLPSIDYSKKRKSVTYGAVFFCIFWLFGSWLFSLYIDHLGTYYRIYGTIGAFAILMVWLFYTSLILLLGAEINKYTLIRGFDKA